MSTADRARRTRELLQEIRQSKDEAERSRKAWQVVTLNEAAAVWIARRYRLDREDGPADARIALYHAALYCDPDKGSYLMVAKWIFLRYHLASHTRAGIRVPISALMRAFKQRGEGSASTEAGAAAQWAAWGYPPTMSSTVTEDRSVQSFVDCDDASDDAVDVALDVQRMERLLARLTPVERDVVQTFGDDDTTLRVVCERHDVSREWGRRVRRNALGKLRAALRVPEPASPAHVDPGRLDTAAEKSLL